LPKFTSAQRQELKSLVTQAIVRRLTGAETKAYVERIMHITISEDHLNHLRSDLKHDSIAAIDRLRKDQHAFVQACFWNRIDEIYELQRILYEVIDNERKKPEEKRDNDIIINAVQNLHDISNNLFSLHTWLPNVTSTVIPQPQQLQQPIRHQQLPLPQAPKPESDWGDYDDPTFSERKPILDESDMP
jgi:hypothetical protein